MLIWIILFFIIIIASFVMALKSMSDYQEHPLNTGLKYSLFLIQNPEELTPQILEDIRHEALKRKAIISLEKLFKGGKTALVIFTPQEIMNKFTKILNLLELEDYSLKEITNFKIFEIGGKNISFSPKLPELKDNEQLWQQIILKPKTGNFQSIIRVVLLSTDKAKEQEMTENFSKVTLPQSYSGTEILKSYRQRILPLDYIKELGEEALPLLTSEQVLALL